MPLYNVRTGLYENNEGKFETYSDAKKIKWKCEKCSQTFQSNKLLYQHKTEFHSY